MMACYTDDNDDDGMTTAEINEALALFYLAGSGGGAYVESHPFIRGSGLKFTEVLGQIGKAVLPIAKSAGKYLGKSALNLLANTGSDVMLGNNLGDSVRKNASIEVENAKFDMAQGMRGVKRRRKPRKKVKAARKKRKTVSGGGGGDLW